MKPKAKIIVCITTNIETESTLDPLWTIQRLSLSSGRSSLGGSPLISPDISILVNGGHLALSGFTKSRLRSSSRDILAIVAMEGNSSRDVDRSCNECRWLYEMTQVLILCAVLFLGRRVKK